MHAFFQKYISAFKTKDAIKLIDSHIERAYHLCKEHDVKYKDELKMAHEMLGDLLKESLE